MASPVLPIVTQVHDGNGDPASGALMYVYDAGTATTRNVYTDSALSSAWSQPVTANTAGRFSNEIFIDPTGGDYKIHVTTSAGATIFELDNLSVPKSGTVSVSEGGTGATTASAARTALSVPSQAAHDAVDTRLTTAETSISNNIDTSTEALTWSATTAIDHASQSAFSITLAGNTTFTVSNLRDGQPFSLYITQDATGGRSVTFPAAFVFMGGERIDTTASATTHVKGIVVGSSIIATCEGAGGVWDYVVHHEQTSGTGGGTPTTGSWQTIPLNTIGHDFLGLGSPSSNAVSLGAGTWEVEWSAPFFETGLSQSRLYDVGASAVIEVGSTFTGPGTSNDGGFGHSFGHARFTLSSSTTIRLEYQVAQAGANGLGVPASYGDERYATLKIKKLSD